MAKYDNQKQPFIYDRATGEKIPVSKEVRDAYYGEAARIRMKEQAHGRCVCPKSKVWACDGDCLICEYHRSGDLASLDVPIGEDGEDMVPWDSPSAFKNAEPCTGGADDYLRLPTEEIIPTAERKIAGVPRWRGIAGYSLAGLFALYAIYQTDVFSRVGCMSGSLWFPGFKEYIFSHEPKRRPDCIYFSLGDKEAKTRNPVLKTVQENTEEIQAFYQSKGIDTVFQLNPGNHFVQGIERTVAGIQWLLNR